ncbi:MAG TPA: alpha/beta fold hydrolase, partial [Thermoanaerobaculia bacterium]|nr:alpha/beta fold hydrolase [Thermoanaerobaculia bacterium]
MAGRATTLLLLALGGILLGSVVTYSRIYSPNPHCGDDRSFLPERGRRASSVGRRYPEAPPPPCARNRHGETEPVGRVTAAHWFVDAAGITWHFVTAGGPGSDGRSSSAAAGAAEASGERPPVVLLHGFPESWWAFHHQIEALAEAGYEAIAIDVIPYGQSDKRLDLDYRSPAIAGAILKLLNRIGVDRFHLVAHDRGSVIGDHLIAQPGAASRVARYVRMQQSASRPHGEPPPHQL